MENLPERVIEDVNSSLDTLAVALDFNLKKRPLILPSKNNTSYYHIGSKNIHIHPIHFDDGIVYFEEIAHLIRDGLVVSNNFDRYVDEFFGRLGEEIGRNITKNTSLERLFKRREPRCFLEIDFLKKYSSNLISKTNYLNSTHQKFQDVYENTVFNASLFKECFNKIGSFIESYKVNNDISKLKSDHQDNLSWFDSEFKKRKSDFFISDYIEISKIFYNQLILIAKEINNLSDSDYILRTDLNDLDKRRTNLKRNSSINNIEFILSSASAIHNSTLPLMFGISNLTFRNQEVNINFELRNSFIHILGYLSAEKYFKTNADFLEKSPALFRLSDAEIDSHYIRHDLFDEYAPILENILK